MTKEEIEKEAREYAEKIFGIKNSELKKHCINDYIAGRTKSEGGNQLSFDDYLKLIGADRNHAIAIGIWNTLGFNNYIIVKKTPD